MTRWGEWTSSSLSTTNRIGLRAFKKCFMIHRMKTPYFVSAKIPMALNLLSNDLYEFTWHTIASAALGFARKRKSRYRKQLILSGKLVYPIYFIRMLKNVNWMHGGRGIRLIYHLSLWKRDTRFTRVRSDGNPLNDYGQQSLLLINSLPHLSCSRNGTLSVEK